MGNLLPFDFASLYSIFIMFCVQFVCINSIVYVRIFVCI